MISTLLLLASATAAAPTSFVTSVDAMAVISVEVAGTSADPDAVGALDVLVDGREETQLLVLAGAGSGRRETLIGPLAAGRHAVALRPSSLWPWPAGLTAAAPRAETIARGDERYELYRWAPRLGMRADTIGTRDDLPLLLYAERFAADGVRRLRYSAIFSNEDGGTPVRALMARWGRTTDIEWASEIELAGDEPRSWSYQAPDHETRRLAPPAGTPSLLVATLNNVFLASGVARASVRMVPRLVDLERGTRESVMDASPWTLRVMARELAAEGKLDAGGGADVKTVADPRRYLYAEARLSLEHATAAAWVETDSGWVSSHLGHAALRVARDGWVRVAIEVGERVPKALAWECAPESDAPGPRGTCTVEATRLFGLGADYRIGENRISPATLRLRAGEMGGVAVGQ